MIIMKTEYLMKIFRISATGWLTALLFSAGALLSPAGLPGYKYVCYGDEVFPVYYASPFIYKSSSLATSMAYNYYLAGGVADLLIWLMIVLFVRAIIHRLIHALAMQSVLKIYTAMKMLLIAACLFVFYLEATTAGHTLQWSANLEEEASAWGMSCSPEFIWYCE